MGEEKKSLEVSWNKFARLLVRTKRAWEEHQELWNSTTTGDREKLPVEFHKFLTRNFNRSKFEIMIPRLIDYYRGYGGIEVLIVKIKEEEKEKK